VRARPIILVVPAANQQRVAHDDPAGAGPQLVSSTSSLADTCARRHADPGRAEPERARVTIEQRTEHARGIDPRQAQPLDRTSGATSAGGLAVGQESVSAIGGNGLPPSSGDGGELRIPVIGPS